MPPSACSSSGVAGPQPAPSTLMPRLQPAKRSKPCCGQPPDRGPATRRPEWSARAELDLSAPAFLALELGAIFLVLIVLNARDRRRARAAGIVLGACATPLRGGGLSLRVRAPLLSRRTIALVDVSGCDAETVWPTVRHLVAVLPPDITLAVELCRDGAPSTTVTLRRSPDRAETTSGLVTKPTCQPSTGDPLAPA